MREAPFNLVIHWHRENIVAKQFLQPHIRNVRNVDGIMRIVEACGVRDVSQYMAVRSLRGCACMVAR